MDVRLSPRNDAEIPAIIRNWARHVHDNLPRRFPAPFTLRWTEQPAAPDKNTAPIHCIDLVSGGKIAARIRIAWLSSSPGTLRITAGAEGLPAQKSVLGQVAGYLAGFGAVAAFLGWVWFAYVDWHRVWNRVSSFAGGYDRDHASKLEVFWLGIGWLLGPLLVGFTFGILGHTCDQDAQARRARKIDAFARRELDGALAAIVNEALAVCARDAEATLALGQTHPGSPHPTKPNLVYSDKGTFRPAPGYTWATDDPHSTAVKPLPPA
jgi:hypothetical protein